MDEAGQLTLFSTGLDGIHENHLLNFGPPLGWVQFEVHLLHSQQEIGKILSVIFVGLLLFFFLQIYK